MPEPSTHNNRRRRPRSNWRRKQNQDAGPPPTFDGPLPPIVDNNEDLLALIDRLRTAKLFAYDSEFIGEETYFPYLCLLQVATNDEVALIDPLADIDLLPFWELIADDSVEKVVHAGQQDLEPVVRHLNKAPVNLFDTQIAAGFVGMGYPVSLTKLQVSLLDLPPGHSATLTLWDERPLTEAQMHYAADDVRHLIELRAKLGEMLESFGCDAWAHEESNNAGHALLEAANSEPNPTIRVRGANAMSRRQTAVLRSLVKWRDEAARRIDRPARSVLKDEVMVDLARKPSKSVSQLKSSSNVPYVPRAEQEYVAAAIEKALAIPEDELPVMIRHDESPQEKFAIDGLFSLACAITQSMGIGPALLTNRDEVTKLYFAVRKGDHRDDLRIMQGWRYEAVGKHLVAAVNGGIDIALRWQNDAIRLKSIGSNNE